MLSVLEPSTSEGNQLGSQEEASSKVENYAGSRYIIGPMVVRVRPDGSPVPEEAPLPRDEDAEEYQAMRSKPVPSLAEISGKHHHTSYGNLPSSIQDLTRRHQKDESNSESPKEEDIKSNNKETSLPWTVEHISSKDHQSIFDIIQSKEDTSKSYPHGSIALPLIEDITKAHNYETTSRTHFKNDALKKHQEEDTRQKPSSFDDLMQKNSHKEFSRFSSSDERRDDDDSISEISARHVSSSVSAFRKARHN